MGFEIGGTIDTYRITGVVGRGGMGRVYQVEHTITKRVEAMKVVIGGQPDSEEHAQRFLTEIRLQASLSHPNIASVYNAFWLNGDLVLVMELVEGPSLQDLLEAGPIPLDTGIGYGRQALRALGYAHDNGVIHRDVSPGNILVAPDGTIKLTDFGIAKSLSGPHYTEQGEALGSVYYAAPEQLKGLPEVDGRADVYSLGAVLYELATGQTVFEADSLYDVMRAQIETEPVPPVEVNPKIPPALNGAILRALAKDPAARFQSANAFLEALEELPGGSVLAPAEAAPAALPERHRRWTPACLLAPLRTAVPVVFAAVIFAALALAVWRDVDSRRSLARAAPGGARPAVQAVPPRPAAIPSRAVPEATAPVGDGSSGNSTGWPARPGGRGRWSAISRKKGSTHSLSPTAISARRAQPP